MTRMSCLLRISFIAGFVAALTVAAGAVGVADATAATVAIQACPYCPPTDATLSEKVSEADAVCLVKFLSSENGEELSMQTTSLEIVGLIKPTPPYKIGGTIEIPIGVTAKVGDRFLLIGQRKEGLMEWALPVEMDDESLAYVQQAPSPEVSAKATRLLYFLNCLGNSNPIISNDAFGEFARAELEDVQRMIEQLPADPNKKNSRANVRAKVRKWLEDPSPRLDVRRAFYGMLLGFCGNDDDAQFLEQKLLAPIDPRKNRLGIEGIMAGYLLLNGEPGLKQIVAMKIDALPVDLAEDDPRLVDLNAVRMTLSFLWDYRRSQFSENGLRAAMRRFLDRPEFADMAVIDLARWKDWSVLDRLINEFGHAPWETRSAQEKIVAYALSCRKDVPASAGDQLPEQARKAQIFLDSLDPNLVQSVKRASGGLSPAAKPAAKTERAGSANH